MVRLCVRGFCALFVVASAMGVVANRDCHAGAVNLPPGYDLTQTLTAYLAYPNPVPPPSTIHIPFTGVPLNTFAFPGVVPSPSQVGITDTIIYREMDMGNTLTNNGDSLTTTIDVVALNLYTNFMGMDLYATLGVTPSGGTMNIVYNGVDGGTWTNDFTVYIDIHINSPLGPIFDTTIKHFSGHGQWSTTPPPGSLIIDGVNKDNNFWLVGPAFHDDGSGSVHVVQSVVPEPSSAALLLSGLVAAGFCRFRRFNS